MAKYDAIAASALRLIARKGSILALTRDGQPTNRDPVTQEVTDPETPPINATFSAVGLPASGRSAEMRLGNLVGRELIELHIAMFGAVIKPRPGDNVTFNEKTYVLKWVAVYDPAADGAVYCMAYGEI